MDTVEVPDDVTTDAGDVPIIALTYVPVRLTDTVPPLTTAEIGETPTTDVRPEVDAGVKMAPPDPSAESRYPFGEVPDEKEIILPVLVLANAIGAVAESVEAETAAERVANSFVSVQVRDGSISRKSPSNSS
jgi:hypothetical protein